MKHTLWLTALSLSLSTFACDDSSSSQPDTGGPSSSEDANVSPEGGGAGGADGGPGGGSMDGGTSNRDGGTNRDSGGAAGGGSDGGGGAAGGRDGAAGGRDAGPVNCSRAPSFSNVRLQTVVEGLEQLVYAAQPPDSSDWWLVEQGGKIRVFTGGALRSGNMLDVSSEIGTPKDGGDERGLLGLAFPSDFGSSNLFYVMMTPRNGSISNHDLVREYRRNGNSATLVRTLLDLPQTPENHNGGTLAFGPDGQLYIGTGDGGEGCGENMKPQDLNSRHGKILRIDPKQSNPTPSVVHYGLRNPFRFSFDRGTGDMLIGDVGADRFEEIDIAPAGSSMLNFGWPAFEGKATISCGTPLRSGSTHTPPVLDFGRRNNGCQGNLCDWAAIVGGVVYRGAAIPGLYGAYMFADFGEEYVASFFHCSATERSATGEVRRSTLGFGIVSGFVEDNEDEVYFVADRAKLMKLVPR